MQDMKRSRKPALDKCRVFRVRSKWLEEISKTCEIDSKVS